MSRKPRQRATSTEQADTLTDIAMPDARQTAEDAGLRYMGDDGPGITRRKQGKGFCYRDAKGAVIRDEKVLARIRSLVIPPAWQDVWICPRANGHIQATGRDLRGRKQYRYHPKFREIRDSNKFDHMIEFATALPAIRARIDADLSRRGLPRDKVLATIVRLLETTMIRVGNVDYAKQNQSYGLTTLKDKHVSISGGELRFQFKGKSGKEWRLRIHDRRIARIVKASQDLPGQQLFQYIDADGDRREVCSDDINAYLKQISAADFTTKHFRTWNGTVLAAAALAQCDPAESEAAAKRAIRQVVEGVAQRLGNTPAVCRKCYIHPDVFDSYAQGALTLPRSRRAGFSAEEAGVLVWLKNRSAERAKAA
ncbi:DNA topoisomerase IB [Croceibacterium xixiisoli]|nr:DNA topoisomerase IB [Croceibacterium xixiisoli]